MSEHINLSIKDGQLLHERGRRLDCVPCVEHIGRGYFCVIPAAGVQVRSRVWYAFYIERF